MASPLSTSCNSPASSAPQDGHGNISSLAPRYVFFQHVSVTGRVMGKGAGAFFFPQVAEKGYQLVYGAT